jgi:hypothetical protein
MRCLAFADASIVPTESALADRCGELLIRGTQSRPAINARMP